MRPMLKLTGTKCLNLKYYIPSFADNFNLCRYTVETVGITLEVPPGPGPAQVLYESEAGAYTHSR